MSSVRVDGGSVRAEPRGALTLLVLGGLAVWLGATTAGQHPHSGFDRVRSHDRSGLFIPNWKFFAPEPAQHDFHVLHRVLTADGTQTPWEETTRITPRASSQLLWFPQRRREKALFDVCAELITLMSKPDLDLTLFPAYRVLRDLVGLTVRDTHGGHEPPQGFQFLIARHTGHDQSHEPDYVFLSPFVCTGAGSGGGEPGAGAPADSRTVAAGA
ncbi:hypothetical protein [Streptomyces sp. NPDC054787]